MTPHRPSWIVPLGATAVLATAATAVLAAASTGSAPTASAQGSLGSLTGPVVVAPTPTVTITPTPVTTTRATPTVTETPGTVTHTAVTPVTTITPPTPTTTLPTGTVTTTWTSPLVRALPPLSVSPGQPATVTFTDGVTTVVTPTAPTTVRTTVPTTVAGNVTAPLEIRQRVNVLRWTPIADYTGDQMSWTGAKAVRMSDGSLEFRFDTFTNPDTSVAMFQVVADASNSFGWTGYNPPPFVIGASYSAAYVSGHTLTVRALRMSDSTPIPGSVQYIVIP